MKIRLTPSSSSSCSLLLLGLAALAAPPALLAAPEVGLNTKVGGLGWAVWREGGLGGWRGDAAATAPDPLGGPDCARTGGVGGGLGLGLGLGLAEEAEVLAGLLDPLGGPACPLLALVEEEGAWGRFGMVPVLDSDPELDSACA